MNKYIWHKDKPKKDGRYLVVTTINWNTIKDDIKYHIQISNFAKNLYEVDKYDFPNDKRSGWYKYDSEYGYYEIDNVIAWTELPVFSE